MKTVNLGGERLGSGKKMNVQLNGFERSTHDLGYIFRSSIASGTLVPFMNLVALPGDTFDIKLDADIKTSPTVGPLFGSFKLQLDVFSCPIRLYNSYLHNNKLGIGLNMGNIKLPQIELEANKLDTSNLLSNPIENQQINQSSLLAYLGIRGLGNSSIDTRIKRRFNALPVLSYWDIYKNYYANKQEKIGAQIATQYVEQSHINVIYKWHLGVKSEYRNPNNPIMVSSGDTIRVEGFNLGTFAFPNWKFITLDDTDPLDHFAPTSINDDFWLLTATEDYDFNGWIITNKKRNN